MKKLLILFLAFALLLSFALVSCADNDGDKSDDSDDGDDGTADTDNGGNQSGDKDGNSDFQFPIIETPGS